MMPKTDPASSGWQFSCSKKVDDISKHESRHDPKFDPKHGAKPVPEHETKPGINEHPDGKSPLEEANK